MDFLTSKTQSEIATLIGVTQGAIHSYITRSYLPGAINSFLIMKAMNESKMFKTKITLNDMFDVKNK